MPGDLLLLIDCIAISMSDVLGGSSSSSSSVAIRFMWVLSKNPSCSATQIKGHRLALRASLHP
jgi:hypothetical protein